MILIVDDDAAVRSSLTLLLKRAGFESEAVSHPNAALEVVRITSPRLILMDMNFSLSTSGEEGIELLRRVKIFCPQVPVILMTAWGGISLAVEGMRAGAFDFVTKPWDNRSLLKSIQTALDLSDQKNNEEKPFDRTDSRQSLCFDNIVGQSRPLMEVLGTVARIAPTQASVLITGESGTGKELIAEAIHVNSSRKKEPFVKVNLGGLSQSLFESEMFGHKKGAFTNAFADRVGRFEMANKGTIFLDEIGDLDLSCQVKLLRVLQDQTFEPLGESRPKKADVRVISATNRLLHEMVEARTFREDLFYRINLITVHLPALRQRADDIPLLTRFFADRQIRENGLAPVRFSSEALTFLQRLPYPGNIRELKNLIERTLLVSGKSVIEAVDLERQLQPSSSAKPTVSSHTSNVTLDEMERQTILKALETGAGNLSHTARILGISRAALYRRLEKYNISF